jgi:hypothetical protein
MSEPTDKGPNDISSRQRLEPNAVGPYKDRLAIYREQLTILLNQRVQFGNHVPPHVLMQINDVRYQVQRIKITLRDSGYFVEDHPDDEDSLVSVDEYLNTRAAEFYSKGVQAHLVGKIWDAKNYYERTLALDPYYPGVKEKLYLLRKEIELRKDRSISNNESPNSVDIWSLKEKISEFSSSKLTKYDNRLVWRVIPYKTNFVNFIKPSLPSLLNFNLQCTYSVPNSPNDLVSGITFRHNDSGYLFFGINIQYNDFICYRNNMITKEIEYIIKWKTSNYINTQNNNILTVNANENKIRLFINGQLSASIIDDNPKLGGTAICLDILDRNELIELEVINYTLEEI